MVCPHLTPEQIAVVTKLMLDLRAIHAGLRAVAREQGKRLDVLDSAGLELDDPDRALVIKTIDFLDSAAYKAIYSYSLCVLALEVDASFLEVE
jgi:hypothetical protein